MGTILDASYLIALSHPREPFHQLCVNTIQQLVNPILLPIVVIPEVTHILNRRYGHHAMRRFVTQIRTPQYRLEAVKSEDLGRIEELLNQYSDANIDFADCAIVALAERLSINKIATFDYRDFGIIRPKHTPSFQILPNKDVT